MVHKKSEYELQYHKLTNDIRAQIWKENMEFRESQKRLNSSDHYWRYQLIDDSCECEDVSKEDTVIKRCVNVNKPEKVQKPLFLHQDKAVQTPDWNETVIKKVEESVADNFLEEQNISVHPVATESVTPHLNKSSSLSQNHISTLNEERTKTKETPQLQVKNLNPSYPETPVKNLVHWSPFGLSPTRNALKNYRLKCKPDPVFAAFACNESNRDVGSHKTYNVRAPVDQVHRTALMASGKRLKELESHLAEQLKKKQQHRSQLSIGSVNSSSIWMTEYQECFSRGQREPLTRSAFRRPVVWRYP